MQTLGYALVHWFLSRFTPKTASDSVTSRVVRFLIPFSSSLVFLSSLDSACLVLLPCFISHPPPYRCSFSPAGLTLQYYVYRFIVSHLLFFPFCMNAPYALELPLTPCNLLMNRLAAAVVRDVRITSAFVCVTESVVRTDTSGLTAPTSSFNFQKLGLCRSDLE